MKTAIAYIDGSGNSSRVQACAVVLHLNGDCHRRTKLLPRYTSNNVGEYNGLLLAIRLAAELQVSELQIYSDSKLIVYQVRGLWKCKNRKLKKLRDRAQQEACVFHKVNIDWVPREENKEADALCRQVIKIYESSPNNPFLRII